MGTIDSIVHTLKDNSQVILRNGKENDAQALLAYLDLILQDDNGMVTEPGEMQLSVDEEKKWRQGMQEHPNEILLIVEHNGEIIGNLDFHIGQRRRLAHRGWLGMAVASQWRGKGVGSILLGGLLKWTTTRPDIDKISLAVLAINKPAINLYQKFGFVEEGRRIREIKMPNGSYIDDILMYKLLGVAEEGKS